MASAKVKSTIIHYQIETDSRAGMSNEKNAERQFAPLMLKKHHSCKVEFKTVGAPRKEIAVIEIAISTEHSHVQRAQMLSKVFMYLESHKAIPSADKLLKELGF